MKSTTKLGFMAALVGLLPIGAMADETLESRLSPLIQAHKGRVSVAVKDLETGESFAYHADEPMVTASLIKFPIMVEAYRQSAAKLVDLDKTVTLTKGDKVPGSGILTAHFSDGATFPLRDAVHLMIVYSDNTATNLVIDKIGIGSTAADDGADGVSATPRSTRRSSAATPRSFPERSKQFGHRQHDGRGDDRAPPRALLPRQEFVKPGGKRGDAQAPPRVRR